MNILIVILMDNHKDIFVTIVVLQTCLKENCRPSSTFLFSTINYKDTKKNERNSSTVITESVFGISKRSFPYKKNYNRNFYILIYTYPYFYIYNCIPNSIIDASEIITCRTIPFSYLGVLIVNGKK